MAKNGLKWPKNGSSSSIFSFILSLNHWQSSFFFEKSEKIEKNQPQKIMGAVHPLQGHNSRPNQCNVLSTSLLHLWAVRDFSALFFHSKTTIIMATFFDIKFLSKFSQGQSLMNFGEDIAILVQVIRMGSKITILMVYSRNMASLKKSK